MTCQNSCESHSKESQLAQKRIEQLDKNLKPKGIGDPNELTWYPATDRRFTVRGLAWFKENRGLYCRLPLRAEKIVRDAVWQLAQCPASARVAFRSDATSMAVRVTNQGVNQMPHMPATGSSGLELFCGAPGGMRSWATAIPDLAQASFERQLFSGLAAKTREFLLYLPLYKGMLKLEIGLNRGARIRPPTPPTFEKPAVFYGTSITQGGCASTAGSDFVSVVGRRLNLDVVNLGFSGNGKGEPELAELISEIDASLYVLDYAGNVEPKMLRRTLPRFMDILRARRPLTPILIMTIVCFASYEFSAARRSALEERRDIMMEHYVRRRRRGDQHIHFADGLSLLPFGTEGAFVDGVHPTTLGFSMMAERLTPIVEQILMRDI
jgi:hypothetical protein